MLLSAAAGSLLAARGFAAPLAASTLELSGTTVTWLLAALCGLLFVNALAAATETALVSSRKAKLQQMAEEGDKRAARVCALMEQPGRPLTAIEVTGGAVKVAAATLTVLLVLGLGRSLGEALGAVALLFLLLLFGELLSKALVVDHAETAAMLLAPLTDLYSRLLYPLIAALAFITTRMARSKNGSPLTQSPFVTEEEIKIFAEQGVEAGQIEEDEKEMIHSIFDFGDTVVREVMVPRIDITAVENTASLDEVLRAVLEEGHSRIPVYVDSIDNIVGILHARDVLEVLRSGGKRAFDLKSMKLRAPYFIPENKKIDELLQEFRASKTPIAIVLDEYQGTAGLVTIEDVVEEIVGDIVDEWDVEEPQTRSVNANEAIFDARTDIEDVNEYLGVHLPDETRETLGGFVFDLFGKLPVVGETVQYRDLDLTVEKVDGHRILEVRVTKTGRPPEEAEVVAG